jgi:lipopolysaccharide exporter
MALGSQLFRQLRTGFDASLSGESLKAKVLRGGVWLGAGSFAEQMARFGRNMILTRLLAPEAFGIMALILSTTSLVHTLTDIGVKEAIIQNPKGTEDRYVGAAFMLAFSRTLSLAGLVFLLAPWAAKFYGNAELTPLFRVVALVIAIDGSGSPRTYIDIKRLKFSKIAVINHGGGISGVIITVILSFFVRDVWALVIGTVAESASRTTLSYILYPYIPSLKWDKAATRDLLKFSRGLVGLSFLNLVFARTDIFVLAKLYPAAQLGFYTMAIYLAQTPTGFIMNLLGQTLMPTFSQIQGDAARENRILIRITSLITLFGLPALVFFYFCGHSLLGFVYGHAYGTAAAALTAAACVAVLNLANAQITTVFYARGLPQLHRLCVLIMAVTMIALIYPLCRWYGIVGGQFACLSAMVLGYLFQLVRIYRLTGLNFSQYGRTFLISAAASVGTAAICLGGRQLPLSERPLANIFLGVVGCIVAYGLAGIVVFRTTREAT